MLTPFRLLVAYDGSRCGDAMIEELDAAGIPSDTQVLVVSVAERWPPPPPVYEFATTPMIPRRKEHATRLADFGARQVFARHPEWKVESEGHVGSPARVIIQRAKEWEAQLVVVGSLGHSTIERMLIGSVSQKVANEAHCSVRVSRGSRRSDGLRLLLAYDAGPGSAMAAAAIAARTWSIGTEVRVVAGVGFDGPPLGEYSVPSDQSRVEALLAPVVQMLKKAGLDVYTTIQEANPKYLIVEEAVRLDTHCIFAGCNDHSILDQMLLGTVSNALIARAPCAVEVVR